MERELTPKEKTAQYDAVLSINRDTTSDGPTINHIHIPVGICRENYVRFITAQGISDNKFWSVDVAAFLSREEILILEDHNAYKKEVDNYVNDEQK